VALITKHICNAPNLFFNRNIEW